MRLGLLNVHSNDCLRYGIVGANGLAYLSSFIKKNLGLEDILIEVDERKIIDINPDVIGISSTTENYSKAIEIAKRVKEQLNIPIIIGGHHISALPHTLPNFIDTGVIGEGEQTMLELLTLLKDKKFDNIQLSNINGIVYHDENGKAVLTPKRAVIDNIDILPFPDRKLLKNINGYNQSLLTTRGCPFDCSFCSATSFWKKVRFHSPERIISEIESIIKYFPNQHMINIDDDLFTINTPRLKNLVELIKESGLNKKVEFSVTARTSVFTESVCKLLVEMNVKRLFIGFEYGVNRILKYLKETVNVKQNQRAVDLCAKYNMNVVGSFIVGVPIETREELAQNYWFIKNNFDTMTKVNICFSNPFPDTGFWDYAVDKKYIDDTFTEWWRMSLEYHPDRSLFMNENYTKEEFNEFYPHFHELQKISTNRSIKDSPYTTRYVNIEYLKSIYQRIIDLIPEKAKNKLELSTQCQTIDELLSSTNGFDKSGNTDELILNNKSYDFIACIHYLETVSNPDKELSNIYNLLNSGGTLLLTIYNMGFNQIIEKLIFNELDYTYSGTFHKNHINMFTLKTLEQKLKSYDFIAKSIIRNTNTTFFNHNLKNILELYFPYKIDFIDNQTLSFIILLEKP